MAGIEANREQCERYAELTLSAATALNPYIGYDKASEIVKEAAATGRSLREVARGRASTRRSSTRRSTTARWRSRTIPSAWLGAPRAITTAPVQRSTATSANCVENEPIELARIVFRQVPSADTVSRIRSCL